MSGRGFVAFALAMLVASSGVGCGRVGFQQGSDAAPSDGSAPSRDATVVPMSCASSFPGALVCSGFEAEEGSYWTFEADNGLTETVSSPVHSGARALHSRVTAGSGMARAFRRHAPVGEGDQLWLRAFVYVSSPMVLSGVNVIAAEHEGSAVYGVDVNVLSEARMQVYSEEAGSFPAAESFRAPLDRWFCVQLHVHPSDTSGSIELAVDGEPIVAASGIDTLPGGDYDRVLVGLDWTDRRQAPVDVYIDDIVVDRAPIACD